MAGFARELAIMIDLVRAKHGGAQALARRRDARLAALVAHARTASPFYRALYRGLPAADVPLRAVPGGNHVIAFAFQGLLEHVEHAFFVFDD